MKKVRFKSDSLSHYLRSLRERKGHSLQDASTLLSVSGGQIKVWEASPEKMPLNKLNKMVDSYQGDPAKLVDLLVSMQMGKGSQAE